MRHLPQRNPAVLAWCAGDVSVIPEHLRTYWLIYAFAAWTIFGMLFFGGMSGLNSGIGRTGE